MTAFATINYAKPANELSNNTGKPLLAGVAGVHVPGLQIAAGGQVVENAEGFSVGPATEVGVLAALLILLLTFGSLAAAGMPLVTAGLGLITGVALIGLATHLTNMSNISPQLALMIGLGVGIDYSLFIVTRFRESYLASATLNGRWSRRWTRRDGRSCSPARPWSSRCLACSLPALRSCTGWPSPRCSLYCWCSSPR